MPSSVFASQLKASMDWIRGEIYQSRCGTKLKRYLKIFSLKSFPSVLTSEYHLTILITLALLYAIVSKMKPIEEHIVDINAAKH
jgi:hypothetical protein